MFLLLGIVFFNVFPLLVNDELTFKNGSYWPLSTAMVSVGVSHA